MKKLKTDASLLQSCVSKSVLLIIIVLFASCNELDPPKQKPFVIVGKNSTYYSAQNRAKYYYQDAKGNRYDFTDANNLYKVGDTIR
jgi:hypothetical protein